MKCKWKICFLLTGEIAFGCAPAMAVPPFSGNWDIALYQDNNPNGERTLLAIECTNFNTTPSAVSGEPSSGTWSVPSFGNGVFGGKWIQQGYNIKIFGATKDVQAQAQVLDGTIIVQSNINPAVPSAIVKPVIAGTFVSFAATPTLSGFLGTGSFVGTLHGGSCP